MNYTIQFGEWLPDQPDLRNPGLTVARNVYPTAGGYAPFYGMEATSTTVSGTVLGAKRFDRTDGTRIICVGTTSDLYVIVASTANASSLSLSLSNDDSWHFEQFGAEVYATAKSGDTYYLTDIDSDTTFSAAPGSPPEADAMVRIGDFLFMGNLTDIDASDAPYRVRWSQYNNPAGTWGTDIATQSGFVDMPSRFGVVTGLSGGATGLIFQKYAVSRIQYVGGTTAFRKETIDEERGCVSPASIVRVGAMTYWLGHDGFCQSDGVNVNVISNHRVWQWFRDNANLAYISRVQGAVDWPHRCIIWSFYGTDLTSYSRQLVYNWEIDRWSYAVIDLDWIVENSVDSQTLEQVAATYSNLDTMPISLDSPVFSAQGRTLSAFKSGTLRDFSGTPLKAQFNTGDFQPREGFRAHVTELHPLVENIDGNSQGAVGTRDKPGATVMYTDDCDEGDLGYIPVSADGRYFRVRLRIPQGAVWGKATGCMVAFNPTGVA